MILKAVSCVLLLLFLLIEKGASDKRHRQPLSRCYAQVPVGDEKKTSRSLRQLRTNDEEGAVVFYEFYDTTTGSVKRSEVVAAVTNALSGGSSFEVQFYIHEKGRNNKSLVIEDLTRNDMRLSEKNDDLSESFSVINAFVKDYPDVMYDVECPAEAENDSCHVNQLDTRGNALVNCWQKESNLARASIPLHCLDTVYNVNLVSLQLEPHFFLLAVRKDVDEGENQQEDCPANLGMDSVNGMKEKSVIFESDIKDLPKHVLDSATLVSILDAEEKVEPNSTSEYDLATNSCVHYAQRIWRSLDIAETEELAQFIITNFRQKGDIEQLKNIGIKYGQGGIRALAAYTARGKKGLLQWISDVVYSQLDIDEL